MLFRNILCSALLASSVALLGMACSNGEVDAVSADGGVPDARLDSGSGDASDDAPDASAPDAQPRTCSDDDFCHTVLPPDSFLRDVWSAGDGVVWAVGAKEPSTNVAPGTVLRWDGSAWAVQFEPDSILYAVWGSSPTDIWIGGEGGLYHGTGPSSDAITWKKVRSELITSIWGTSTNDVWAVGAFWGSPYTFDGTVLHYRGTSADGGDGWEIDPISSSRPASYRKVWGTSANDVWIGGAERLQPSADWPRMLTLRGRPNGDGGLAWSEVVMPSPGDGEFSGGGVIAGGRPWLMGRLGNSDAVFMGTPKTDGSSDYTWFEGSFGTCNGTAYPCQGNSGVWFNRAVWGTTPNDVYLGGDFGQLRHWDGTSFSLVKTTITKIPVRASFYGMWGTSSTDLWIVGDRIALHKVALGHP
ncbi:hypothetical protein AKJ09_01625 [Labilithrix luteola]|uniref:Type IV fimbrial biogenesis protein PilY1 n=1 Tax=Labilithrix luteola TaxID=1391654 RepID=A0A0K1PNI9_9BACT|nr:hypothetical protein AKJ09_01625 [Labilithrix luteola]